MKHRKDAGFSLAALIFIATAVSILASAAYPAYQMQAKRQMEEELIFRGEEYARAVQKFYRKFGVYPPSIDALVQTNGLRFLRRVYKDPITGKDFRVISISPDGTLIGSTLPTQRINNTPLFGAPVQTFGGQTPAPVQPTTASTPSAGTAPSNQTQRPSAAPAASTPSFGQGPRPQASASPQPATQAGQGAGFGSSIGTGVQGFQQPSGGTFGSAGIVGVGSESSGTSIKVYNQRQKYNEWEFIAIMTPTAPQAPGGPTAPTTGATPAPGAPPPPGTPPGPGGSPPPGGNPMSPFQTPSQPPFKRP
jgi:type II secretory pathway pseudopilin PulG